jgi:hypothetical protein
MAFEIFGFQPTLDSTLLMAQQVLVWCRVRLVVGKGSEKKLWICYDFTRGATVNSISDLVAGETILCWVVVYRTQPNSRGVTWTKTW